MWLRTILVMFALGFDAAGEDAALGRIRELLTAIRVKRNPEPTRAKQALRDWVESRLRGRDDLAALASELNRELRAAKLSCDAEGCPDRNALGYLGELRLERQREYVILYTRLGAGAGCAFDESAYAYTLVNGWQRFWQGEQTESADGKYLPYAIYAVRIATPEVRDDQRDRLVLMLAKRSACAGNWHPVVKRLWRTNPGRMTLLLDESEGALHFDEPPIQGSLTGAEALMEYRVASLDAMIHNRAEVRRYRIDGDRLERVDPVALNPADFVEHWLSQPWSVASQRSEGKAPASAHQRWHSANVYGRFVSAANGEAQAAGAAWPRVRQRTWQCREPDLRQVAIDLGEPAVRQYFVIRWRPPWRFTMVAVQERPHPGCQAVDWQAEDLRTLFPR